MNDKWVEIGINIYEKTGRASIVQPSKTFLQRQDVVWWIS